jgi:hypothetical protein
MVEAKSRGLLCGAWGCGRDWEHLDEVRARVAINQRWREATVRLCDKHLAALQAGEHIDGVALR